MPRSTADNQRIKDERREAILVASRRVFARRGLVATKISDIAHAAGLSHGLVYHYFESKEAIYVEAIRELLSTSREMLDAAVAMDASPLARLTTYVEGVLRRVDENPEGVLLVLQVMVQEQCCREARVFFDDHATHGYEAVRKLIVDARRLGEIDADGDPDALLTALFALMHGVAFGILLDVPVPRRTPDASLVLRLLRPTDERARTARAQRRPTPNRGARSRREPA